MLTHQPEAEEQLLPLPPLLSPRIQKALRNSAEGAVLGLCLGASAMILFLDAPVNHSAMFFVGGFLGLLTGTVVGFLGGALFPGRHKSAFGLFHVPALLAVGIAILSVFWILRTPTYAISATLGTLALWPFLEALVRRLISSVQPPRDST